MKKLFEELNDTSLSIEVNKSKQNQNNHEMKISDDLEKRIAEEVLKREAKEKDEWGQYSDVMGPYPASFLMSDILREVIKNIRYNPENFNRLYHESLDSCWDDEDDEIDIDYDPEDLVAMRIIELEKSTISDIEQELDNIQYELHELEHDDLPHTELEMYELEDGESKEVVKGNISKIRKRIQELEVRKKQLLIMFCQLAKKLAEKYLVTEE